MFKFNVGDFVKVAGCGDSAYVIVGVVPSKKTFNGISIDDEEINYVVYAGRHSKKQDT